LGKAYDPFDPIKVVALEMSRIGKPPTIHFGWTDESPVSGTLGFLLFGEGNVRWEVRELILKAEPDPAKAAEGDDRGQLGRRGGTAQTGSRRPVSFHCISHTTHLQRICNVF
jgi:hypothetical protein